AQAQYSLCSGQTGDGHAEGRAAYVVESNLMEERNTIGITAVLTADTQLDGRIGLTAFFYGHANQLTNTFAIQCLEWIDWQDLHVFLQTWNFQTFDVLEQEFTLGIVAAIAKGGLSQ